MNNTVEMRDFIIDFLRKELVGPGYSAVQIDGQEVLRVQDSPRQRYSAGILFPSKFQMLSQHGTTSDEETLPDIHLHETDQTENNINTVESDEDVSISTDEVPPENDREVTLANEFLPSAMGLSTLLEVPECLRIEVEAGMYALTENLELDVVGDHSLSKGWRRRAIDNSVEFYSDELLGDGTKTLEKAVFEEDGQSFLTVHVVSRLLNKSAKSDRSRLITFSLINRRQSGDRTPNNTECFFQCKFKVRASDGQACFQSYPEQPFQYNDDDELSLQLLHLHRRTYAIGHGCAADWEDTNDDCVRSVWTEVIPRYEIKPVLPTQIEGLELNMKDLMSNELNIVTGECERLCEGYAEWITEKETELEGMKNLTPELKSTGKKHLENCRKCLQRMRRGIDIIKQERDVRLAFQMMNEAMLMQLVHYKISTEQIRSWVSNAGIWELEKQFERPSYNEFESSWYPFQLAFILMNIESVSNPQCTERNLVDVIWFPTGGGKTEAYLGLSAFTMFLRRLRNPEYAGTCILMRYTLRLLTTQQFQRAASLVCSCEIIRRRIPELLGKDQFSIGLWVGGEVTPNKEKDAVTALNKLCSKQGENKFIIRSCPWCGAEMGQTSDGKRVKGYRQLAHPKRVRHVCDDQNCEFNDGDGLPLAIIDEHIYSSPPTLLIGTVDKFAMLSFQPEARRLFGIGMPYPPPELIIQDELHLISGPLGSMVGLYETVIDELCTHRTEDKLLPAKIIASTATIARAESQVNGLYARNAFLFPPQGLKTGDSYFAEEREDKVGRTYVGVFATALPSHVTAQVRTMSALLQAPKLFDTTTAEVIDPYWTMMGYFNSLRELGHAATLIRSDISEYLTAMRGRLGLNSEDAKKLGRDRRRFVRSNVELTSRIHSSQIPVIIQRLFLNYDGLKSSDVVDVCFATNMIQVGIDIRRLSLMTIIGQPKTTSEYIQASSRIGRHAERPGIVVTNYNPFKPRDRSHYERFRSYHQGIYRHVEPTSVTAFSTPVRERALHALVIILCRFWGDNELRDRPKPPPQSDLVNKIKKCIEERVKKVDKTEWLGTEEMIDEIINKWTNFGPSKYGGFGPSDEETPLMYPAGTQPHPNWDLNVSYPTPSSMRNVDATCEARRINLHSIRRIDDLNRRQ